MRLVVTVMVRDEVDIIAAMVEHHRDQGADLVIATDNGSVDGTADVLQAYADAGVVELHHDPVHRKQQHSIVTGMARRARTEHAADWVVNADADEFWVPVDRSLTLRKALEAIPLSLNAFPVPVVNLVGPPAERGSGVGRLLWRDRRSTEALNAVGLHAHPTDDAVHRGEADVVVAQGNHFVSLPSNGRPDPAHALEVLHVPWRSWAQAERKVRLTGLAYEASPDLRPSKNHHGMADYRRLRAGYLRYAYLARLPTDEELIAGEVDGSFLRDAWLSEHLHGLVERAVRPDLLRRCLDSSDDSPLDAEEHRRAAAVGHAFLALERERNAALARSGELARRVEKLSAESDRLRAALPPQSFTADTARLARRVVSRARRTWRARRRAARRHS